MRGVGKGMELPVQEALNPTGDPQPCPQRGVLFFLLPLQPYGSTLPLTVNDRTRGLWGTEHPQIMGQEAWPEPHGLCGLRSGACGVTGALGLQAGGGLVQSSCLPTVALNVSADHRMPGVFISKVGLIPPKPFPSATWAGEKGSLLGPLPLSTGQLPLVKACPLSSPCTLRAGATSVSPEQVRWKTLRRRQARVRAACFPEHSWAVSSPLTSTLCAAVV